MPRRVTQTQEEKNAIAMNNWMRLRAGYQTIPDDGGDDKTARSSSSKHESGAGTESRKDQDAAPIHTQSQRMSRLIRGATGRAEDGSREIS